MVRSAHVKNDPEKPLHQSFEMICSADVGGKMEAVPLIAEDTEYEEER